ncbi:MAG TPA: glutathione S-transferase [Usitatibacter sp.]|nr:glutathione S-transferase [Usitatibacter sp.]
MALRIWGRLSSVNVQKVVWCADELGLDYERRDAGGRFGLNDTREYLAMNPTGLVPLLEDGDFALPESNAIVRYLAAREKAAHLWPEGLRERARVDRWMEWQSTEFTPAMRDAFWQLIRVPEAQRNAAAVEASRAKSERLAGILDGVLASRPYLAGDRFTLADIVNGCAAHRWLLLPVEREKRPHLERWYASLKSRPASAQVTSQPLS